MIVLYLIAGVLCVGAVYSIVRELIMMFTPIHCPRCNSTQHDASILRPGILICQDCKMEHIMPVE